jgi:hypothetical protein
LGAARSVPDTAFLLPKAQGVRVAWVMPPRADPQAGQRGLAAKQFAVDGLGNPWFGDGRRKVASPLQSLLFDLDLPYDDFTITGDGELIFATRGTLGLAVASKKPRLDKQGLPLLALDPQVKAPLPSFKLYPAPQGLYLAGPMEQGYVVFYLQRAAKGRTAFKKLLTCERPISALAGDGKRTFVALGDLVLELGKGKPQGLFKAKAKVTGLAWVDKAGLFYCTSSGGGYVSTGARKSIEFFSVKDPSLFAWKGSLYVYLSKVQGVARLEGAQHFKDLFGD